MPDPIKNQQLIELEAKLKVVQDRAARAFEEAKIERDGQAVHDFTRVKVYGEGLSTVAVAEKVREDNAEMDELSKQMETLRAAQYAFKRLSAPADEIVHPPNGPGKSYREPAERKTLGQRIVATEQFKAWGAQKGQKTGEIFIPDYGLAELKTLFETTAGWSPESVRSGRLVEAVTRPAQILDIIPPGTVSQAAYVYMEETTRTQAAAEKAEGATYAESAFVLTERSETVRKITDSVPVTDEQLEDVSAAQSYLDMRIRFGLRQRLDNQIIQGDGIAPNLTGILNKSGIQTQAKGADPVPDAFFKAMTLVRVTGRAIPTAVLIHPNDWQGIRLLRTADGIYIWGNPSEAGPERLWGLPVVVSDVLTENTGLVGGFADWCQLLERRGILVEVGFTGTQFVEGKQTIRASLRVAFAIYRAAAFCTVTGI